MKSFIIVSLHFITYASYDSFILRTNNCFRRITFNMGSRSDIFISCFTKNVGMGLYTK